MFLLFPKSANIFFICSDEAYFCLKATANKQNNRMWLKERPTDVIEVPLRDQKVLVWCAFSASKIYGPYFFEESVNQHNFLEMLKTFFWIKHLKAKDYKKYYFQQDGATPHTANIVHNWLTDKFSEKFYQQVLMATKVTRFESLRLLSVGLFEVSCLQSFAIKFG